MSCQGSQTGRDPSAFTRRDFLRGLVAVAAGGVAGVPRLARATAETRDERVLSLVHLHTREEIEIPYWGEGRYLRSSLSRLDLFLRDFRTGERHPIDPALLDQLHELRIATGSRAPFQVISGFRSRTTNEALRSGGGGQARHSLHVEGRAIDVRLADVRTRVLRDAALELGRGGVGYYRAEDFVHVDTGPVRRW